MSTHHVAPAFSSEQEIEEYLMTVATDGNDAAIGAVMVARTWPHPTVRRREFSLFTGYGLSLADVLFLQEQASGPVVHVMENGEPLYGKWAAAFWLYTLSTMPDAILPLLENTGAVPIPEAWLAVTVEGEDGIWTPHEVALHRLAEAGDWTARNMILYATYWPEGTVESSDVERFSLATVLAEDIDLWVRLAYGEETARSGAVFNKWEIAFWMYELVQLLPAMLGIPLLKSAPQSAENGVPASFLGSGMDWEQVKSVYRWLLEKDYEETDIVIDGAMVERGYEKLAARAGMPVEDYKKLEKPVIPAGQCDMDEKAALMDAHGYLAPPAISGLTLGDFLALPEEVDKLEEWELQLLVERAVRRLPWPVDQNPFPWSK